MDINITAAQILQIIPFLVNLVNEVTSNTATNNPLGALGNVTAKAPASLLGNFAADPGGAYVLAILRKTAEQGDISVLTKVAEALIVLATQVHVTVVVDGGYGPMVVGNAFDHLQTKSLEVKLTGSLKTSPKGRPTAHMDVPRPKADSPADAVANNPLNGLGVQAPQTPAGADAGFREALSKLASFFPNS